MYTAIKQCRICGNTDLVSILNLGTQYLTSVFPKSKTEEISSGPLELVKCNIGHNINACGLVQLKHSYDLHEMYGDNYGYRSGLNESMINHLYGKVEKIRSIIQLTCGDLVIDIGSNDSTLLQAYRQDSLLLVGIDPSGEKFKKYYPKHIHLIPDFFSAESVKKNYGNKKAKVVTSIAMFYDLERPVDFMQQIYDILADDGIWFFEQSYLATMLEMTAYDTICHEHLEYYAFKQIKWMTDKVGFKIIDVELDAVNGGSFSVTVAKLGSKYIECKEVIDQLTRNETAKGLSEIKPYEDFKNRIYKHRNELKSFILDLNLKKKSIFGYGASTKGNVILQFCGFTNIDIPAIAEVNEEKFGCFTPGTYIPIISEKEAKDMKPDYFFVLPWHFKESIILREKDYLDSGGNLFFPLPFPEVVYK